MTRTALIAAAAATVVAAPAFAQVLDGALTPGEPYQLLATQTSPTGFGDNTNADPLVAGGSELNALYGAVAGNNLALLFTGNVETGFNKFTLFIDSSAGGQNTIVAPSDPNNDIDFGALGRLGTFVDTDTSDGDDSAPGLTFDDGFNADFALIAGGGNDPVEFFVNAAQLSDNDAVGQFLGGTGGGNNSLVVSDGGAFDGVQFAIDNSNVAGVTDTTVGNPGAVTTGIELFIPLSVLGNPTGDVGITAFINGSSNDFVSNQVLPGVPDGTANLGEPRNIDFGDIAGDQFATIVVPEPASLSLLAAAGLALVRRR
jgi:hypothetical protein